MVIRKVVEQDWHIVCGSAEIEELTRYGKIREWSPRNQRHALFLTMKYPTQVFYKGDWGQELLHYDKEPDVYRGKCGRIFCSYNRYIEIADWFLKNMFPP